MNKRELGEKIATFVIGTKVDGTVAAVFPPTPDQSQRYVVSTEEGMLDVNILQMENPAGRLKIRAKDPLKVGDKIRRRVKDVKVWSGE